MREATVFNLIFSFSASIYGNQAIGPISESNCLKQYFSHYNARTQSRIEQFLLNLVASRTEVSKVGQDYFWTATRKLKDMIEDARHCPTKNSNSYKICEIRFQNILTDQNFNKENL